MSARPHEIPDCSFAEIAVALHAETRYYAETDERLELLTHKLAIAGLSENTCARLLADAERQRDLVVAAFRLFRAMCDHEEAIRSIIEPKHVMARVQNAMEARQ